MPPIANIDLLLVGAAIAGAAMLALAVYVSRPRSATARALLLYAAVTIGWSLANFVSYRFTDFAYILWSIRLVLFFAVWHAFSFLLLALQFPHEKNQVAKHTLIALALYTGVVSFCTLTPWMYESVIATTPAIETSVGWGIVLFAATVLAYIGIGIGVLMQKFRHAQDAERRQYQFVVVGVAITFFFIVGFNFILPAFFNTADLIPYGGLFQLPLIALTAYAILRHHLFNVKVAATALLIFVLSIVSVAEIIVAGDIALIAFRSVVFLLVLLSGALLIRGVYREISQRELIEQQAHAVEEANQQQESLLHFISHEVRGYLTKNEAAFAAIADGTYGTVPDSLQSMATEVLGDTRRGVATIMDILDAANLKKGTVEYTKNRFDLDAIVEDVVTELRPRAEEKQLTLSYKVSEGSFALMGDAEKIQRHVVRNVIDNSIHYTQKGSVSVELERINNMLRVVVSDTGVGITPEDMKHLFTEGGKGKESLKINVHSTGYGLFIAKTIVDAHGGKIWAESEGKDKGARFIIELPSV